MDNDNQEISVITILQQHIPYEENKIHHSIKIRDWQDIGDIKTNKNIFKLGTLVNQIFRVFFVVVVHNDTQFLKVGEQSCKSYVFPGRKLLAAVRALLGPQWS